jgi:hypothetical protein
MATAAKATNRESGMRGSLARPKPLAVLAVGRAVIVFVKDDVGLILWTPGDLTAGDNQVGIFEDSEAEFAREACQG